VRLGFISAGAAQGIVGTLAAAEGIEVTGLFGAVGAMLEKFTAGAPCDILILTRKQVAELAGKGAVLADTVADVGSVATSIAVPADHAPPNVSNARALTDALMAADAIYFPDPSKATAGIHFAKVLDELRVKGHVVARLRPFPNGATAMREMAAAKGKPIGCTQATEILATPGVRLVAPLPAGLDLATVYTAAVSAQAAEPQAARAFVRKLTGEASWAQRVKAGFA